MIAFDVIWFGYGAGVVLCGWFAGVVVGVVLSVLGRIGKLGCLLALCGLLAAVSPSYAGFPSTTMPNFFWTFGTTGGAGLPWTVGVQVTCSQDSVGVSYPLGTGGAGVPWACYGALGFVNVPVPCIADANGEEMIGTQGDQYTTGANVYQYTQGNSASSLVCLIVGALTATAFAYAAGSKFL